MQVRILGARQGEWPNGHFTSFLIDGHLAIDAGALAVRLTLGEQERIRNVLITHRHYDHVKDLASFGFNMMTRTMVTIHGLPDVKETLERTLFHEDIWINFFKGLKGGSPSMRFSPVSPGQQFEIDGYAILPIAINHPVPTVGYQVTSPDGGTFYYTSDNGPGAAQHWVAATPDVLATEVTFSNRAADLARSAGHLTPAFLAEEIERFRAVKGYVPRIVAIHLNPYFEDEIRAELAVVAQHLGATIEVGVEDLQLLLS